MNDLNSIIARAKRCKILELENDQLRAEIEKLQAECRAYRQLVAQCQEDETNRRAEQAKAGGGGGHDGAAAGGRSDDLHFHRPRPPVPSQNDPKEQWPRAGASGISGKYGTPRREDPNSPATWAHCKDLPGKPRGGDLDNIVKTIHDLQHGR